MAEKMTLRVGRSVFPQFSPRVWEQLQQVAAAHISDNMARTHGMASAIRPIHGEGKLMGTALTVRTRPGDNLVVHHAADIVKPGQVIVVDAAGGTTHAILGEIICHVAMKNGARGFIVDGAIRDADAIRAMGFPVFARGVTHAGPLKGGPGEINVPVSCGGVVVQPGDLVVGDGDGVVVVPQAEVEEIVARAYAQLLKEEDTMRQIEAGTMDRSWVRKRLANDPDFDYQLFE